MRVDVKGLLGKLVKPKEEEEMLIKRGEKITYDSILADVKTFSIDPMCGIGKFTREEELANHIFKRFKLAAPERVEGGHDPEAQLSARTS